MPKFVKFKKAKDDEGGQEFLFVNPANVSWVDDAGELPDGTGYYCVIHLVAGGSLEVKGAPIDVIPALDGRCQPF